MTIKLLDTISRYLGVHKGEYQQGIIWEVSFSFARIRVEDIPDTGEDRVGSWSKTNRLVAVYHNQDELLRAHRIIRGKEEFDGFDRTETGSLVESDWTVELDKLQGELASRLNELISELLASR